MGEDLGRLLFVTLISKLGASDCRKFRSGEIFRVEGSSGMARSDGVSGMDPVSCKFLGGSTW